MIGSTILITCKADGAPVPKITWTKDRKQVSGGRYKIVKDGLRIAGVQKVDEGSYKCLARNKLDTDEASGSLIVKRRFPHFRT